MSLSTSAESSQAARKSGRSEFALRRLHSLTGVIPLGVFATFHALTMANALLGREAFEAGLTVLGRARLLAEAVILGGPLLFHAGLGVGMALRSRPNVGHYPSGGSWAHAFQRWTGLVTLAFVLVHLWQTRVSVALMQTSSADFHSHFAGLLSSTGLGGVPWWAAFHLVGVAAVSFHLSNGIVGFAWSFGLVRTLSGLTKLSRVCIAFGALLFVLGSSTVLYFATGSPSFSGAP